MKFPEPALSLLHRLWQKGIAFLGCSYGILGGAMTWISDHALVSAISEAGGFGVLAVGSLTPLDLEKEIEATRERTNQPFGVNLILFRPDIDDLVNLCGKRKISHIFLGGGIPTRTIISRVKDMGARVIGFAPSVMVAKRMVDMGVDALVIEGHEAGGHVGPVTTHVLAQEIIPHMEVPVFVAGGIGDGVGMLSYLLMGASGCQLGTRFVCAEECNAHPRFKEAFLKARARDATISPQLDPLFPVIPVRALENKGKRNFILIQKEILAAYHEGKISQKEAQLAIESFWAGSLRRAVLEGDVEEGSVMAGQSVGMVCRIEPCATIIQSFLTQATYHLANPLRGIAAI